MYDDLVNILLYDAGWLEQGIEQTERDIAEHLKKAADAIEERDRYALTLQHEMMVEAESHIALVERLNKRIEELELHCCPHAIRNVHDRGDDSICRELGTEPPKEERINEVRINLNEVIKVKLTDLGKDIYYHQFDE